MIRLPARAWGHRLATGQVSTAQVPGPGLSGPGPEPVRARPYLRASGLALSPAHRSATGPVQPPGNGPVQPPGYRPGS